MELLIQVSVDPVKPTSLPPGDVIVAFPDGHRWGTFELEHANWRIVHVPGMGQHEADSLCAEEIRTRGHTQKLRERGMTVDVVGLGLTNSPRDPHRHWSASVEAVIEHADFRAASTLKTPVV